MLPTNPGDPQPCLSPTTPHPTDQSFGKAPLNLPTPDRDKQLHPSTLSHTTNHLKLSTQCPLNKVSFPRGRASCIGERPTVCYFLSGHDIYFRTSASPNGRTPRQPCLAQRGMFQDTRSRDRKQRDGTPATSKNLRPAVPFAFFSLAVLLFTTHRGTTRIHPRVV
jgi:hypothetical protein